jgi:hypothetical protein
VIAGAALVSGAAGLGATGASATSGGEPLQGGTLIVAGNPDVLWMDPTAAYSAADYQFQRMTLRNLFDYPNSGTLEERATPLPDLAVEVPTRPAAGHQAAPRAVLPGPVLRRRLSRSSTCSRP